MTDTFKPTAEMAAAAKRAIGWIKDGHAGQGFTDVGRKRASQLAGREPLSAETVRRMHSFFSRHKVDKQGEGFNNLSKPSPGRVAWDAWGGDAGAAWAKRIVENMNEKAVMADNTQVFARLLKSEEQADGSLLVTGIATDDSIDSDEQVCDPEWLKSAMPGWFRWGNIREQHSNIAAGVATEYKVDGSQHLITAHVVDPGSVAKVLAGVLKGFSIGIRGARVAKDSKAAGGRIVDGEIVEVSLVDRPANPVCTISLAKAVGGVLTQVEELKMAEVTEESTSEESTEESNGAPEASGEATAEESTSGGEASSGKAPEESSQEPGEESSQEVGEESSREGGVAGVAGKADDYKALHGRLDAIEAMCKEMYDKMCGPKEAADKSAKEDIVKAVEEIATRVSAVEKQVKAPARMAVTEKAAAPVNEHLLKAAEYRSKAMAATNPQLAEGYIALAIDLERSL